MHRIAQLAFLLFLPVFLIGQEGNFPPPDTPVVIQTVPALGKITIDGKLEEASWQQAKPVIDFFRMEPRQGGDYQYQTSVRILFDERHLYVGAFCADSMGKKGIRVQDLRRDFAWGENDNTNHDTTYFR